MDQRTTFQSFAELQKLLLRLQGTRASFIFDHEGLTRLDGVLTALRPAEDTQRSELELDGALTFRLGQVIAVNGLFRWDYTEC